MTWVHAVFATPSDARDALRKLAEEGVRADDVEVRSSAPLEELPSLVPKHRSRVPLMAVLGGLVGGTVAFLLASLTAKAYPLPTGGMPIVPLPPSGIITFEGVAVGAILFTVATVFYEGGLLRPRSRPGRLDGHLAAGHVLVSVRADEVTSGDWASKAVATETTYEGRP